MWSNLGGAPPHGERRRVRVVLRVRPLAVAERKRGCASVVEVLDREVRVVDPIDLLARRESSSSAMMMMTIRSADGVIEVVEPEARRFGFDACFGGDAPQAAVFEAVAAPVLRQAWAGFNSSILAYGQTGAGKTYSMTGDMKRADLEGLAPRLCSALFDAVEAHVGAAVEVSYMEIYQETVRDLLLPTGSALRVREHPHLGAWVPELTRVRVETKDEALALLAVGSRARATAATRANARSSRSHAVFTLAMTRRQDAPSRRSGWWSDLSTDGAGAGAGVEKLLTSRLDLVDLAGSERVSVTGSDGRRLNEAKSINKSLATLCDVINALAHNKNNNSNERRTKAPRHVPYRNSALTWLLKETLGGNGFATMLCAISPCDDHHDESLATLKYAERARTVKRSAVANTYTPTPEAEARRPVVDKTTSEGPLKTTTTMILDDDARPSTSTNCWPRLSNLNPDPDFAGKRVIPLDRPVLVGAGAEARIRLVRGEARVAVIGSIDGVVVACALSRATPTHVDGRVVRDATVLRHGARVVFDWRHAFRFEAHAGEERADDGDGANEWDQALSELAQEEEEEEEEEDDDDDAAPRHVEEEGPASPGVNDNANAEWLRDLLRGVRDEVAKLDPRLRSEVLAELDVDSHTASPRHDDDLTTLTATSPLLSLLDSTLRDDDDDDDDDRPAASTDGGLAAMRARVLDAQRHLDAVVTSNAHLTSPTRPSRGGGGDDQPREPGGPNNKCSEAS